GPITTCIGSAVFLQVPFVTGYSYQWLKDGSPISGANSTGYNATVTGVYSVSTTFNGCTGGSNNVNITVQDILAPTAPVLADINIQCTTTVTAPVASDNCAGSVTGTTLDPTTYSAQGDYVIHWTFNDGHGNTSTATQNVHVHDVTPPVPTCPANITTAANTTQGNVGGAVVTYAATATDNCGVQSITSSPASGSFFPVGTTVVTTTVVDVNGLSSTCTFNVTVTCTTPPTPTVTVVDNCNGTSTLSTTATGTLLWSNGATTSTTSVSSAGTYTITTTVNGCTSVAGSGVAAPKSPNTIAAGINLTTCINTAITNITLATTGATGATFAGLPAGVTGSWSGNAVTISGTPTVAGTYSYTVTLTGGCGNVSTSGSITVTGLTTPIFTQVAAICSGATLAALPTTSTNNIQGTWSPAVNNLGTTTYTFTPTAGQCATTATMTITVNPLPTITGTLIACAPTGRQLTGSGTPAASNPWVSSNTSIATVNNTGFVTAVAAAGGSVVITYTDANGCSITSANFTVPPLPPTPTVSVVDNCDGTSTLTASGYTSYQWVMGGPVIATSASITVSTAGTYYVRSASSQCVSSFANGTAAPRTTPVVNILPNGPTTFCAGGSVVLTSSSATGNVWSTGATTQSITVSASGNYTVTVTQNGCSGVSPSITVVVNPNVTPTFTQVAAICSGGSLAALPTTSNESITGTWSPAINNTTTSTYTFTPAAGQCATSATMTITVNPIPTATIAAAGGTTACPGSTITLNATPSSGVTYQWKKDGTDISGATGASYGATTSGAYTVVVTSSSNCVSAPSNAVSVLIQDITAPVIVCPASFQRTSDYGVCGRTITWTMPTATDNCSGVVTVTQIAGLPSGSVYPVGVNSITLRATDAAGNTSTCSFNITVINNSTPFLVGIPSDVTVQCSAVPAAAVVTSYDPCTSSIPVVFTEVIIPGVDPGHYIIKRTWKATNAVGNSSIQTQTITVTDTSVPTVVCPANIVVTANTTLGGQSGSYVTYTATATDNCGVPTLTYSIAPGSFFAIGTTTVTATANDGNGNSATCSFTVTVTCVTPPTPAVTVVDNCNGTSTLSTTATGTLLWSNGATTSTTSVSSAGTYTVTTTVNGCTSAAGSGVASPKTTPNVFITPPGSITTCIGSAVFLQAPFVAGYSYQWLKDGSPISGANSTAYTVTVTGVYSVSTTFTGCTGGSNNANITLQDNLPPVSPVLADINTECSVTVTAPVATDNCVGPVTGTTSDDVTYNTQGDFVIHWTFNDGHGNTSTATQNVHVHDVTPPVPTCPADITTVATVSEHGIGGAIVTYAAATATDNCGVQSITYSQASNTFFPIGTTVVTTTVVDVNGLSSTCTFNVIVNCVTPVITGAPRNQTIPTDAGLCSAVVGYTTVATGVPAANLTYTMTGATTASGSGDGSGSVFNKGVTT
ncbi:MAG: HYR domain-containing protein, partial [Sediminibacterium sp.]